ncbi:SusD/RagB family nutrient-binding outer membrane lipoprotein [Limibacter armeniacum]|uniref:SusD/RagB family nutrient-binding outer membrane lipoprotein n=1 Tax=Limibacter armeniacum TaxID=466084 RepID=UPI002FE69E9B
MIHNIRYRLMALLAAVTISATSCDMDKFLDVNETEDFPTETTSDKRLPGIQGMVATSLYQHTLRDSYIVQYRTTLWGTSTFDDRWDYRNTYRIGEWRRHYFDVGGNVFNMIERSTEDGDNNYQGVGKSILAYSTLLATDHFGDMPVYEAFTGNVNPTYDAQEEVYNYIFGLLDEAEQNYANANASVDAPMDASIDLIYEGDMGKWKAFNHALKAKALLHLTAIQPDNYAKVLEELDKAQGMFTDAVWSYSESEGESNAWRINPMGPSKARPQWDHIGNDLNNSVPTTFFMSKMKANSVQDPRLPFLMMPAENSSEEDVEMFSGILVSSSIGVNTREDFPSLYEGHWTKNTSALPILTKEELKFMEAEAAFQTGDVSRAFAAYQAGIRMNMERLGVSPEETTAFLSSELAATSASELKIYHIMEQKYVALYLSPETWTDMRRYNFDTAVYRGITYPEAVIDELGGKWISRLPYDPQTEYIYNLPEIERLGAQAPDWVVKKMWWQK